jgi:hypothetical protein
MARSALYSQAIQKQQQQHTTSSEPHSAPKQAFGPPRDGAIANKYTSHQSTPQLTYHQLQQQQFLNRQNVNTPQDQKKQEGAAAGEKVAAAKSNLTAIEIPAGASSKDVEAKFNGSRKVSDGSIVTPSITKADPLDNPIKYVFFSSIVGPMLNLLQHHKRLYQWPSSALDG